MTVYVAIEITDRDQMDVIRGVYDSLEAAQRAHQVVHDDGQIAEWIRDKRDHNPVWYTLIADINIEAHELKGQKA